MVQTRKCWKIITRRKKLQIVCRSKAGNDTQTVFRCFGPPVGKNPRNSESLSILRKFFIFRKSYPKIFREELCDKFSWILQTINKNFISLSSEISDFGNPWGSLKDSWTLLTIFLKELWCDLKKGTSLRTIFINVEILVELPSVKAYFTGRPYSMPTLCTFFRSQHRFFGIFPLWIYLHNNCRIWTCGYDNPSFIDFIIFLRNPWLWKLVKPPEAQRNFFMIFSGFHGKLHS